MTQGWLYWTHACVPIVYIDESVQWRSTRTDEKVMSMGCRVGVRYFRGLPRRKRQSLRRLCGIVVDGGRETYGGLVMME